MIIEINITPADVVNFGHSVGRDVTEEAATKGLELSKDKAKERIAGLRRDIISRALDFARMTVKS